MTGGDGDGAAWRGVHALLHVSFGCDSACLLAFPPGCRLAVSLPTS